MVINASVHYCGFTAFSSPLQPHKQKNYLLGPKTGIHSGRQSHEADHQTEIRWQHHSHGDPTGQRPQWQSGRGDWGELGDRWVSAGSRDGC